MVKMTLDEALKRVTELEEEVKQLKASVPVGMSGWLVTAPNKMYSGVTLGVMFRGGQAFVPDGADAERITREMAGDFGYSVQRVDDWREISRESTEKIRRNMIDVLGSAQVL